MTSPLAQPLGLPSGAVLPNRIVKAAMSEGLSDARNHATPRLTALYRRWATSGAGLLLSGNIQVDRMHLERANNVVLEDGSGLPALAAMVAAAKSGGAQVWAQLGHTGRQVIAEINPQPLAPSAVELVPVRAAGLVFAPPRAMTEAEIEDAIARFAVSARLAKAAGFDGVQIHGAHGYLVSQFLNPLANRRTDRWGGSLANRARLLLSVIAAIRAEVGPAFPTGLKLNSSDFQKGGFTHAECLEVVAMLNGSTLDLLELSGGSMEQPKMMDVSVREEGDDGPRAGTRRREAYFLALAGDVKRVAAMPVLVTGGFRTRAAMEAALVSGDLDLVGLGRPLIADPDVAGKLIRGEVESTPDAETRLPPHHLMGWFNMQLERLADGLEPDPDLDGEAAATAFASLEAANIRALQAERAGAVEPA